MRKGEDNLSSNLSNRVVTMRLPLRPKGGKQMQRAARLSTTLSQENAVVVVVVVVVLEHQIPCEGQASLLMTRTCFVV